MKDKFLVYTEEFDMLEGFSDTEIGILFRALLNFVKAGEKVVLSEKLAVAFMFMSAHIKRDQEKYQCISEKRRAAAKKSVESREEKLSKRNGEEKKTVAKEEVKTEAEEKTEANCEKENEQDISEYKKENIRAILGEREENEKIVSENKNGNEQVIPAGEKESGQIVLEGKKGSKIKHIIKDNTLYVEFEPEKEGKCDEGLCETDFMFSANDVALRLKLKKNSTVEEKFEEFYNAYPKKMQKKQARDAFIKLNPDIDLHKKMILAIEKLKVTENWKKENGRYIPFPAKWIDMRKWEDKIVMTREERIDLNLKSCGLATMESFDTKEFYNAALKKSMRA
ncbi:MAG: hypothetical protein E7614_04535 [Ruminococcaceae bacterium]|nr:hypothetical protein [Oscillospiraceae bacterium]